MIMNINEGNLGKFIKKVAKGKIPKNVSIDENLAYKLNDRNFLVKTLEEYIPPLSILGFSLTLIPSSLLAIHLLNNGTPPMAATFLSTLPQILYVSSKAFTDTEEKHKEYQNTIDSFLQNLPAVNYTLTHYN